MAPHARWKGETTDELRIDIDSGRTADKVDWPDPAMAPLGTDDEAAGMPPSRQRIEWALRQELARRPEATFNVPTLDAPTRFYFVFIVALALVFIGFGLLAPRP
jgi:hypothetical protein